MSLSEVAVGGSNMMIVKLKCFTIMWNKGVLVTSTTPAHVVKIALTLFGLGYSVTDWNLATNKGKRANCNPMSVYNFKKKNDFP